MSRATKSQIENLTAERDMLLQLIKDILVSNEIAHISQLNETSEIYYKSLLWINRLKKERRK